MSLKNWNFDFRHFFCPIAAKARVVTGGGNLSIGEKHRLTPSHWQLPQLPRHAA